MKDTGKMIFNMDLEKRFGLITRSTRVNTTRGRNMAKVLMYGLMAAHTKETGMKIGLKVMVHTLG